MEAIEAIITRRSTRKYADKIPEKELIEKVINAGRHAPSGGNSQTTHFIVFTDRESLIAIMEAAERGQMMNVEAIAPDVNAPPTDMSAAAPPLRGGAGYGALQRAINETGQIPRQEA